MLKKLVKYGNSNALVLDKALLELLEIEEGSYIKISTDGRSLIITPATDTKGLNLTGTKALQVAMARQYDEQIKKNEYDHAATKAVMPAISKIFQELFEKYKPQEHVTRMFENPEYQKETADLALQYDPIKNSKEYMQATLVLRYKYAPELKAYDDEVRERTETLNEQAKTIDPTAALSMPTVNIPNALAELHSNSAYLKEIEQLYTKLDMSKISPEELLYAVKAIRYKYVPELLEYDPEFQEASAQAKK